VTALLFEPSDALPLVHVAVSVRAGAVHDPADRLGLARVTARMLRRGADGMSAEAIDERVDALGADLGLHAGLASTALSFDVVRRSLEPMAELAARLLARPTFDAEEVGRLVRQSEAEIVEARDDDGVLVARALRRRLFGAHPQGRRVGGTLPTLAAIGPRDVRAFHRAHHHRQNATVAVSGAVTEAEARALADRLLAELPEGEPSARVEADPPPPRGRRLVLVDKPDRTQAQMLIGTLGTRALDEDHVALVVANTAFGGMMSSRLTQEVRGKRGWSYGASSQLVLGTVRESFAIWSAPAAADAARCLALELELCERWRQGGIDAGELRLAKDFLRRSYAFEVDTARKRLHQKLERVLLGLPDDFHARWVERVEAVTLAEANEAVARRIDDRALWIAVVCTAGDIRDELARAVPDLAEIVVEPFDVE
jgi:zinc protease